MDDKPHLKPVIERLARWRDDERYAVVAVDITHHSKTHRMAGGLRTAGVYWRSLLAYIRDKPPRE